MEKSFLEYYDFYEGVCKERLHLQGQNMQVMTVCKCALLHFTSRLIICHFGCRHNIRSITLCKHWSLWHYKHSCSLRWVIHVSIYRRPAGTKNLMYYHTSEWRAELNHSTQLLFASSHFCGISRVVIVLKSRYESLFRHFVVVLHIVKWSCCSDGDWILLSLCDLFLLFL